MLPINVSDPKLRTDWRVRVVAIVLGLVALAGMGYAIVQAYA